jgi:hypothetical protein
MQGDEDTIGDKMSELNVECYYVPDDGYTISFFLKGEPQMYGEVRGRARPLLIEERSQVMESVSLMKGGAADCKIADILSQRLVEWDIPEMEKSDGKWGKTGKVLPITAWNILHLRPHLYNRFAAIVVWGTEGGDMAPEWAEQEKEEFVDHSYTSALSGRLVGQVAEEARGKN